MAFSCLCGTKITSQVKELHVVSVNQTKSPAVAGFITAVNFKITLSELKVCDSSDFTTPEMLNLVTVVCLGTSLTTALEMMNLINLRSV